MYLKCGYLCCRHCLDTLEREPGGDGFLCPACPVVTKPDEVQVARKLRALVEAFKPLQRRLQTVLRMDPSLRDFQGKDAPSTHTQPAPEKQFCQ